MFNRLLGLTVGSALVGAIFGLVFAVFTVGCTPTGKQTDQSKENARERNLNRPTHRSN